MVKDATTTGGGAMSDISPLHNQLTRSLDIKIWWVRFQQRITLLFLFQIRVSKPEVMLVCHRSGGLVFSTVLMRSFLAKPP